MMQKPQQSLPIIPWMGGKRRLAKLAANWLFATGKTKATGASLFLSSAIRYSAKAAATFKTYRVQKLV